MSVNIKLAVFVVITFLFGSLFLSTVIVKNRLDSTNFGNHFVQLDSAYKFELEPQNDKLNILILTFKNPGLGNTNDFDLTLSQDENVIREVPFSGRNIGDPSDLRFQFDPVINSNGAKYIVTLTSDNYSYPVSIYVDSSGNPSYRTYYRSSSFAGSLSRMSTFWMSALINNLSFFIVWLILLGGILWFGEKR